MIRLFLFVVLITNTIYANDKVKQIKQYILKLNPNVSENVLEKVAKSLSIYTKKPKLSVAIAMQESSFRNVITINKNNTKDYGVYQLNGKTIEFFNGDIEKVMCDLDYASKLHVIILNFKIRTCLKLGIKKEKAWSCYRSYNKKYREEYYEDVKKHLKKLKD